MTKGLWDAGVVTLVGAAWLAAATVAHLVRSAVMRRAPGPDGMRSRAQAREHGRQRTRAENLDVARWAFAIVGVVCLVWVAFLVVRGA